MFISNQLPDFEELSSEFTRFLTNEDRRCGQVTFNADWFTLMTIVERSSSGSESAYSTAFCRKPETTP